MTSENLHDLSFQQINLYKFDKLFNGTPIYNVGRVVEFIDDVDVERLQKVLNYLIRKHVLLRTKYIMRDNCIYQSVSPEFVPFRVIKVDSRFELVARINESIRKLFPLDSGQPFMVELYKLSEQCYVFIKAHHIACDMVSFAILLDEMIRLYNNADDGICEEQTVDNTYFSFVDYQRNYLYSKRGNLDADFWNRFVEKDISPVKLDFEGNNIVKNYLGNYISIKFDEKTSFRVSNLCKTSYITPFKLFFSSFILTLSHYSGVTDMAVGTTVHNRINRNWRQTIGNFANVIPVYVNFDKRLSISDFMKLIDGVLYASFKHSFYPLERIVTKQREQSRTTSDMFSLFQHVFVYQQTNFTDGFSMLTSPMDSEVNVSIEGSCLRPFKWLPPYSHFNTTLFMSGNEVSYFGYIEYSEELYKKEDIMSMRNVFYRIVLFIVENPSFSIDYILSKLSIAQC